MHYAHKQLQMYPIYGLQPKKSQNRYMRSDMKLTYSDKLTGHVHGEALSSSLPCFRSFPLSLSLYLCDSMVDVLLGTAHCSANSGSPMTHN